MRRTLFAFLILALAALMPTGGALAYSYASPNSDPLIKQREAYLGALSKGDWAAAETAYKAFEANVELLTKPDESYKGDPGLDGAFETALAAKDAKAAKAALDRAYVDQIDRRLGAAEQNIANYQTAQNLVVIAQAFFQAMSGDLPPETRKTVSAEMGKAIDAVGKPGVFGYGQEPADPAAFKAAYAAIMGALKPE